MEMYQDGPEGVLAASALDAFDCFFQGRFIFDNENDVNRAKKMGIDDLNKKYFLCNRHYKRGHCFWNKNRGK